MAEQKGRKAGKEEENTTPDCSLGRLRFAFCFASCWFLFSLRSSAPCLLFDLLPGFGLFHVCCTGWLLLDRGGENEPQEARRTAREKGSEKQCQTRVV
jgi:hypothetical protein